MWSPPLRLKKTRRVRNYICSHKTNGSFLFCAYASSSDQQLSKSRPSTLNSVSNNYNLNRTVPASWLILFPIQIRRKRCLTRRCCCLLLLLPVQGFISLCSLTGSWPTLVHQNILLDETKNSTKSKSTRIKNIWKLVPRTWRVTIRSYRVSVKGDINLWNWISFLNFLDSS